MWEPLRITRLITLSVTLSFTNSPIKKAAPTPDWTWWMYRGDDNIYWETAVNGRMLIAASANLFLVRGNWLLCFFRWWWHPWRCCWWTTAVFCCRSTTLGNGDPAILRPVTTSATALVSQEGKTGAKTDWWEKGGKEISCVGVCVCVYLHLSIFALWKCVCVTISLTGLEELWCDTPPQNTHIIVLLFLWGPSWA